MRRHLYTSRERLALRCAWLVSRAGTLIRELGEAIEDAEHLNRLVGWLLDRAGLASEDLSAWYAIREGDATEAARYAAQGAAIRACKSGQEVARA